MLLKFAAVSLFAITGLLSSAQQVTLYSDCNYAGSSGQLAVGRYYSYQLKIPNDRLSSIRIPYGMKITIYEHDIFQGRSRTLNDDVSCLAPDWRNMASSVVVEEDNYRQSRQNDYVVFYNDCYQRGVSQTLRPGTYTGSQLGSLRMNISSFTISGNLRVRLFLNNENASGNSVEHNQSVYCLSQSQNDKTGSLIIEYKSGAGNSGLPNGENYATFYTQCDYRGNALRLMPGTYSGNNLGLLKNNIASVQVPAALQVRAYSSENTFGSAELISTDVSCLDNNLGNRIASLVVENRSGNGNNQSGNESVTIYENSNYQGKSAALLPGMYSTMAAAGNFPDNALSSVSVPAGYRVVLYEFENFGGKSYTLTSSVSGFIFNNWNDRASSIAVYKDR